ncbi:MAG: DUF2807 domain-containing protein [Hyphomonadaceae bacterium]|nr:DUF2807 domain-containing protein [Hyphomonadaceae bacterium]
MERFVFFAAIVVAVIFGIVALARQSDWGVHFDADGGGGVAALADTAPGRLEPLALSGERLRLRHLAARVEILPEERADFLVEIENPGGAPMPQVTAEGGVITVDGQLRGRIDDCIDGGAELDGYGTLGADQLPRVVIRAPRVLNLTRSGAGTTAIGAAQEVDLDVSGCSAVAVGDVAGVLSVELAGSGSVQTAAANSLKASIAGSGEVATGAIAAGAEIDLAGSGNVSIASLTGDLSVDSAGSGDAEIGGGQIGEALIDVAGSGNVVIAAPVNRLDVDLVGSGNVEVDAAVGALEAEIAGSGNVRVDSVTGSVTREVWGSGEVNIGE